MKSLHDEPSQPARRHQGTDHQRRAPHTSGTHGLLPVLLVLTANGGAQPVRVGASVKNSSDDVCSEWLTLALVGTERGPICLPRET